MKKSEKEAIAWLFGVIGVLFILVGIFLKDLTGINFTTGLIIAVICWIIAGVSRRVWKVEKRTPLKKPRRKKR